MDIQVNYLLFFLRILALIVENTFTSIPHMAQLMVPGASSLPRFFYKNKVNNNLNDLLILLYFFSF